MALRAVYPRLPQLEKPVGTLDRIGDHMLFYGKGIAGIPFAASHYRREIIRLIAEISMGAGSLAMIGGTLAIVGFLMLAAGGTLAVQGYSSLGNPQLDCGVKHTRQTPFLAASVVPEYNS